MPKSKRKAEKPSPKNRDLEAALGRLAATSAQDAGAPADPELVPLIEDDTGHRFIVYASKDGPQAELRYDGGTFWASQKQMADMFGVNIPSISRHLKNIFEEGELDPKATLSQIERVATEGERQVRRQIDTYNLNAIISVGYRVGSKQGTMFRNWATDKLFQILTKGFYIDKERLKNRGDPDALDEFREIAREIRTSIQNSYREVLQL